MQRYVQNRVLAFVKMLLVLTDAVCLNIIFLLGLHLVTTYGLVDAQEIMSTNFSSLWTLFNLIAIVSALYQRLYTDNTIEFLESVFRQTFRTAITFLVVFSSCTFLGHPFAGIGYYLATVTVLILIYSAGSRFCLTYVYTVLPKRFNWNKRVALIGHYDYLAPVADTFSKGHAFFSVNTIDYRDKDALASKEEKLKRFTHYFKEVSKAGIHDVFIVSSPDISDCSQELIMAADHQCVQLNFVPAMTASIQYGVREQALTMELPVLKSHEEPMSSMENRVKKRLIDLAISMTVMVFILSWLVPIIGIIIKIQSPGPIFFKQPRSGRNNTTFGCYKFRSMVVNKDANAKQASKDDNRITPIGKFLRKTNLDEFPQFINVFLGQMSVVGPRPHMLSHTEHYSQLIQHYMVRHFVKPGITGWAQANGYRGETKAPELMAKRVEYDLEYMSNWSAMLDFKIVCMTALNMIRGEKNAF
jgi:Undecaprenyl-phosphate glucose phosphotransferase